MYYLGKKAIAAFYGSLFWNTAHNLVGSGRFSRRRNKNIIFCQVGEVLPVRLFSYDSLTGKGSTFKDLRIRYLADPDLVYLMKNKYTSVYAEEYFSRDTRRVPMWKSEAEFKNLFRVGERETISRAMEIILTDGTPKRTSRES